MVKSVYSPLEIPEMPVHQIVFNMISLYGDKTCCVDADTGRSINFTDFKKTAQNIASGLVRLGVKKGDVIAFFAPNSVNHLLMFYGCLAAGATVTSINPVYTAYEVGRQIKDAGAKYIFTTEQLSKVAVPVKSENYQIREIIVQGHVAACVPFQRLVLDDGGSYPEDLTFDVKKDIAMLPYSSGTTGLPKGVMLTHYNVVSNLMQIAHPETKDNVLDPSGSDDMRTVMAIAPFYHSYGLTAMMVLCVAGGARLIIMPKFSPKFFLETIQKYKVRYLPVSPPLVVFLAKSPMVKQYDLSSIKGMTSGAAPLSKETEDEVKQLLKLDLIKQGYGLTESTCVATVQPLGRAKPGSVGKVLANSEIEIRDVSTGKSLGPYQRGEICIKGPQIMTGYLNRDDETKSTLKDGWLHTGDIGYYDDEEMFYIVDRIKELIKVKGLQVAPAELEALLLSHPGVADVAVIGIPHARTGEVPRAYVVLKDNVKTTAEDLKEFVKGTVSRHKWLEGGIQFRDIIPKSENGKILRRVLKDQALKEIKSKL